VYDDFSSSTVDTAKWSLSTPVVHGISGKIYTESKSSAGGTSPQLVVEVNSGTKPTVGATASTKALPARTNCHAKVRVEFSPGHNADQASFSASVSLNGIGHGAAYLYGKFMTFVSPVTGNATSSVLVIYKGNDLYDLYVGGVAAAVNLKTTKPTLSFSASVSAGNYTTNKIVKMIVDDVVCQK